MAAPSIDFIEVIGRRLPRWHLDAACRGEDPDLFFPSRGEPTMAARAICAVCPVLDECLDWAISLDLPDGIFGGLSPSQRRVVAIGGDRSRRGSCGGWGAPYLTVRADERFCGQSCRMKAAYAAANA